MHKKSKHKDGFLTKKKLKKSYSKSKMPGY